MATDDGAERMRVIAKGLKEFGDKGMQREFSKAMTKAVAPLKTELPASAMRTLPRRGGLAARVAGTKFRVSRSAKGGVRLVGRNKELRELKLLDKPGSVRHPVFQRHGQSRRQATWVVQRVRPGWFSTPAEAFRPEARTAMLRAAEDLAKRVENARRGGVL